MTTLFCYYIPLHEAYSRYGSTRVICCFCILASQPDLLAATTCLENHDVYRALVELECVSRFAFQQHHWLGDLAPALLAARQRLALTRAKRCAQVRERAEARIPPHLRYTAGWPTVRPTHTEAMLLAEVRRTVADISEIPIDYCDADAIVARYDELMRKQERIDNLRQLA